MYRQGDVLITPCAIPSGLRHKEGRCILAEGEATGHAHVAIGDGVEMYEDDKGVLWLSAPHGGEIVHEEHDKIDLAPGSYRITHQREYSPEEIRRVAD